MYAKEIQDCRKNAMAHHTKQMLDGESPHCGCVPSRLMIFESFCYHIFATALWVAKALNTSQSQHNLICKYLLWEVIRYIFSTNWAYAQKNDWNSQRKHPQPFYTWKVTKWTMLFLVHWITSRLHLRTLLTTMNFIYRTVKIVVIMSRR